MQCSEADSSLSRCFIGRLTHLKMSPQTNKKKRREKEKENNTYPISKNERYEITEFSDHPLHVVHFRDIKLHHVLNAVFQGDRRAGASSAGPDQLQLDCAVLKTLKDDIASILLHRWPCEWKQLVWNKTAKRAAIESVTSPFKFIKKIKKK